MESNLEEYLKDYEILKEEIVEGVKIIIVEEIKKKKDKLEGTAQQRYYEKNKEKINSRVAEWRKEKMHNDPEFKEKAMETKKRYKERKKLEKECLKE